MPPGAAAFKVLMTGMPLVIGIVILTFQPLVGSLLVVAALGCGFLFWIDHRKQLRDVDEAARGGRPPSGTRGG